MPIPKPMSGEERGEFVSRCVSAIASEFDDNDQAVAVCIQTWNDRDKAVNEELLLAIIKRGVKKTEFNYGILTADLYVKTVLECVGSDICYRYAATKGNSFDDILKKAAKQLVYSNEDMIVEEIYGKEYKRLDRDGDELELPKNTLMVFRHVLTTDKQDRDGDIMRTDGAIVDPKMLLLWQHIPTLPIGKHLGVTEHTDKKLSTVSAIVDMNELSHDAAVMVDNDMARFSHGFRALKFEELKQEGKDSIPGFDISEFEVMEKSMVSIPSNTDANVEEVMLSLVEGGKLTSHIMKSYGEQIREHLPKRVPVEIDLQVSLNGKAIGDAKENGEAKTEDCGCTGKGTGESSASKETDAGRKEKPQKAEDQKMMIWSGMVSNSWEYIEDKLREQSKNFVVGSGIEVAEHTWVGIVATFSDHAIITVENHREDNIRFYKADWHIKDDKPQFVGIIKEVEIEIETTIREKMLKLARTKAGARLSKDTLKTLQEIKEDVDFLKTNEDLSRSGSALCEKCIGRLDDLLNKSEDVDDEDSKGKPEALDVKQAMSIFLSKATAEERKRMAETLNALQAIENRAEQTKKYSNLVGIN